MSDTVIFAGGIENALRALIGFKRIKIVIFSIMKIFSRYKNTKHNSLYELSLYLRHTQNNIDKIVYNPCSKVSFYTKFRRCK